MQKLYLGWGKSDAAGRAAGWSGVYGAAYLCRGKTGHPVQRGEPSVSSTFMTGHCGQAYGWVPLFSTNILLYVLLVLYVAIAVKEKQQKQREKHEESENNAIPFPPVCPSFQD